MGTQENLEGQFWGTVLHGIICGDNSGAVLGDLFWEKILTFGGQFWRTSERF